jgi:hypothetical protein
MGVNVGAQPGAGDERLLYRTMVLCGGIGAAILLLGFLLSSSLGPRVTDALPTSINSIRAVDSVTGRTIGSDSRSFSAGDNPAGVVDFTAIPAAYDIEAEWYDDGGTAIVSYKPVNAGDAVQGNASQGGLAAFVVFDDPRAGLAPGSYTFVVERYENGRVTEVLARATIRVGP